MRLRFSLKTLRIATRNSPLALWQAEHVRARLQAQTPDLRVELVALTTEGDRILDRSLALAGGKGLFIKELEQALLERRADIAVHSLKDVTVTLPVGLCIAVICEREDPRDAFVSNEYGGLRKLPAGARVGTSSLRRQCQLRAAHPHLQVVELRGNVNTRLAKLDAGRYDAILLAVAGMKRLGQTQRIRSILEPSESLPAVGQGAIGIECRADDAETRSLLAPLDHTPTRICVQAERALNAGLGGGCQVPIGGYAVIDGDRLHLRGLVGDPNGSHIIRDQVHGTDTQMIALGEELAQRLLARGARSILDKVYGGG